MPPINIIRRNRTNGQRERVPKRQNKEPTALTFRIWTMLCCPLGVPTTKNKTPTPLTFWIWTVLCCPLCLLTTGVTLGCHCRITRTSTGAGAGDSSPQTPSKAHGCFVRSCSDLLAYEASEVMTLVAVGSSRLYIIRVEGEGNSFTGRSDFMTYVKPSCRTWTARIAFGPRSATSKARGINQSILFVTFLNTQ